MFNFEGTKTYLSKKEIYGGIAQLGERLLCKQEVSGSIPLISTTQKTRNPKNKIEASFDFERKN